MINSVFRACRNYYSQVFFEECKYIVEEKKIPEYIIDDIEIYSDGSDEELSDEENSNDESFNEEN